MDISALRIEENPLKHLEENLLVSLDKIRGKKKNRFILLLNVLFAFYSIAVWVTKFYYFIQTDSDITKIS